MRGTTMNTGSVRTLALLCVLAAVWIGYTAVATGSVSAKTDPPSVWTEASEAASANQTPTLTNDVGQPEGGAGPELALGLALVGVGVLAFAYGIAAVVRQRRDAARMPPDAHADGWPLTAKPPVRTRARS